MLRPNWALARLVVLATVILGSSGCATVIKGTTQGIPVNSEPDNADVLVDGQLVGTTPTTVEMKRKRDHLVTIEKDGYQPKTIAVVKDIGGAVFGNILAGGLIGWGVDAASGAQYNLNPKTISVKLEPVSSMPAGSENDSQSDFIAKLNALDELKENGQITDEEYGKGRLELFKKYMPEMVPDEQADPAAGSPSGSL